MHNEIETFTYMNNLKCEELYRQIKSNDEHPFIINSYYQLL